jgi:hypothetical protein
MKMNVKEWNTTTFKRYEDYRVWMIAFPLPPVHIRGLLYMPDCYSSKTFDWGYGSILGAQVNGYKVITVAESQYGPAVLISIRLGELLSVDSCGGVSISRSSICASVSYANYGELKHTDGNKYTHAREVTIDGLNFTRSCNAGSHVVVPQAPHLTALLQWDRTPSTSGRADLAVIARQLGYISPSQAELVFPGVKFGRNCFADTVVSTLCVSEKVRYTADMVGLGEWVVPYLRTLRTNHLRLGDPNHVTGLQLALNTREEDGRGTWSSANRERSDQIVLG